jgi:signal transduction histidine kinase
VGVEGNPHTMEAVGRLAGRIAHHLNNLLTVVEGNASFLEDALGNGLDDRQLSTELQEIRNACGRTSKLTTQLLSISGYRWSEPRLVDLRTLVSGMDLGYFFEDHVGFRTDFAAAACPVRVDPTLMEEVVLALVLNAREAVGSRGTVRVGIDNFLAEKDNGGSANGWVQLEVSDSGPGMDEETLSKAFHPFFSTRPFPEDRGLGLSVAYGIVQQSRGSMIISSAPGSGTTVRMRFPAAASVSASDRRS